MVKKQKKNVVKNLKAEDTTKFNYRSYLVAVQLLISLLLTFFTPGFLNIIGNSNLPRPTIFSGPYITALIFIFIIVGLPFTILKKKLNNTNNVVIILTLNLIVYTLYNGNSKLIFIAYYLLALVYLWLRHEKVKVKFAFQPQLLILPLAIILTLAGLQAQVNLVEKATALGPQSNAYQLPIKGNVEYIVEVFAPIKNGEKSVTYKGSFNWNTCNETGAGVVEELKNIKYGVNKDFYSYDFDKNRYVMDKTKVLLRTPVIFTTYPVTTVVGTEELGLCRSLKALNRVSFSVGSNKFRIDQGKLSKKASNATWDEVKKVYHLNAVDVLTAYYNLTYQRNLDSNFNEYLGNYTYYELIYENEKLVKIKSYFRDNSKVDQAPNLLEEITFKDINTDIKFQPSKSINLTSESVAKGLL